MLFWKQAVKLMSCIILITFVFAAKYFFIFDICYCNFSMQWRDFSIYLMLRHQIYICGGVHV